MESPLQTALTLSTINFSVSQMDDCADITDAYIRNFGMLPAIGDTVLFMCLPMAVKSGQFFTPIKQQLQITDIYFDGMFLSFILPPNLENIVFSIYLSQPVNPSVNYTGTKVRYMGCFTTKTFLSLTDTPSSYVGKANKIVSVRPDETGLEFTTPSSGGLTCATLVNCPKIQSMDSTDLNIISILIAAGLYDPGAAGGFGALYNGYAAQTAGLAPVGWHVPSNAECLTLQTAIGGSTQGGKLKETGFTHWDSPNTAASDLLLFHGRGAGWRSNSVFQNQLRINDFWTTSAFGIGLYRWSLGYANANFGNGDLYRYYGISIRLIKDDSIDPGTLTDYDGNTYPTCKIGSQVWLAANYKNTHLNSGISIPNVSVQASWNAMTSAAMCYINNIVSTR